MSKNSYFNSRNCIDVMLDGSKAPPQRKIGGAFLYEDTTTYLFSRTNYGKSLLVFQLAYAAATGTGIANCEALKNEFPPMKVAVVDLELSDRDLFKRHGAVLKNNDPLARENLFYLHEKIENKKNLGFDLVDKIEPAILEHNASLVIIDNITCLLPDSLRHDNVMIVVSWLDMIRKRTGASVLAVGHTTKGHPRLAIQPNDFFGSSMLQNFFKELFYIDATNDGRFFLCHSKTKSEECYVDTVPVFTRGKHPVVGVGFNYEAMMPLAEVQLPFALQPDKVRRKINLKHFRNEIAILDREGVSRATIAELLGVSRTSIYNLLDN